MKRYFIMIVLCVLLASIEVASADSLDGVWTINHCGGTYNIEFSKNAEGGFSGRYVGIDNSSMFNGKYYPGRGKTIVNFIQRHADKDYYAAYIGFLSGNKVEGILYDVSAYKCNFTMNKK
jgi:hypothetical protein